ncbi:hypothetical protein HY468_05810 [Candidatus Roizmanbacteria bacterium]|nr:hypothetical protein [Candidatus Roizmanbacteria bacterium]
MAERQKTVDVLQNTQTIDRPQLASWMCLEDVMLTPVSDLISQGKQDVARAVKNNEMWTLPGTGFSVTAQMQRLFDSFEAHEPITVEEFRNQIAQWSDETVVDVVSFQLEYLSDRLVYPIQLAKDETGEVICPRYGNTKYTDIVQETERDGVVKQSAQQIEAFLKTAPSGTVAFFTSPPGWSGLTTDKETPITFPDTQTYLFRIKHDGTIESATVQTQMTIDENRQLLESFGERCSQNFQSLSSREQIKSITGKVVQFSADYGAGQNPFQEVVQRIHNIVGSDVASKTATFDSIFHDLHRINSLMETDQITHDALLALKNDLATLTEEVLRGQISIAALGERIGEAVLTIASYAQIEKQQRNNTNKRRYSEQTPDYSSKLVDPSFAFSHLEDTLVFLQTLPGCNGGGNTLNGLRNSTTVVLSAGGLRLGMIDSLDTENSSSNDLLECVRCPFCEEIVNAYKKNGRIHCPSCKESVECT